MTIARENRNSSIVSCITIVKHVRTVSRKLSSLRMLVPVRRSIHEYRNPANLTGLLLKRQFASGCSRVGAPANASQAYRAIDSWAENDSLKRCSASYCQLSPPPRSTIAAAFSPDGQLVASTQ